MRNIKIAIFGAGSLGSVVGALLSRKNDVLLITRGEHLRAIKENGLKVVGETTGTFYLEAEASYPGGFDMIILTVKAYQTEDAVKEIMKEYNGEPVITFQNGVGLIDLLTSLDVIPGVTTHGATLLEPGVVRHAGYGDTFIGEKNGDLSERIFNIATNFNQCGFKTEVVNDIMERRWLKAAINACINPLTAIMGLPNGALLDENLKEVVRCVAEECSHLLAKRGIHADVFSLALEVIEKTRDNFSSMLQDIMNSRKTEIDFITRPFIEGKCNETLYHMVRFLEEIKSYKGRDNSHIE